MRAGFAARTINPDCSMPLEGLSQKGLIQSIHDDLRVRALRLQTADSQVLILAFDLLFMDTSRLERLEANICKALDLSPEELLINFSHTHAGPRVSHWSYSGHPDETYLQQVEDAAIAAGRDASQELTPVTLVAGETTTDIPLSRRQLDADGIAQWKPAPDEEVCRALPFLVVQKENGEVLSVVCSISCHPSMIYTNDVSADFPGAAVAALNAHFGTTGALFLQGAGGDTKPRILAPGTTWDPGTWEQMEATGQAIADSVVNAVKAGQTQALDPVISSTRFVVELPLEAPPSREELARIMYNTDVRPERRLWASDMSHQLEVNGALPTVLPVVGQIVSFGDQFRLVGLAGELVGELGNLIRDQFDRGITAPLGYTNGVQVYIPSDRQLPQHGYEVDSYWEYHWPAPLAHGVDDAIRSCLADVSR